MPLDWLSWEFWAKDTQGLYHLALIVGGTIGLWLLFIRTRAVNRSADAALEQAKTAADRHEEQTVADRERTGAPTGRRSHRAPKNTEQRVSRRAALAALKEAEKEGTVAWDELKRELGLG